VFADVYRLSDNAGDLDVDEDAMIADYLASQLGDFEIELESRTVSRDWPKGRSSKLLYQTLCVGLLLYTWLLNDVTVETHALADSF